MRLVIPEFDVPMVAFECLSPTSHYSLAVASRKLQDLLKTFNPCINSSRLLPDSCFRVYNLCPTNTSLEVLTYPGFNISLAFS